MSDSTGRPVPDADAARVAELGYTQELKREFGFFHAFAISFADTSLIVAFYGVFALSLGAAGPTFFWGLLVVLVFQLLVALVLGEVASIWPLAGGIYQWTRQQTGAKAGWFAAWAYWWTMVFAMSTCAYAAASFILPGLGVTDASKGTYIGLSVVIALIGLAINSIAQSILKFFVSLLLFAELTTTLVLAIVLFFFYRVNPFSTLLHSFNTGAGGFHWLWIGWLGAVAFMGWTFLGFDAAGSIAEEVHDPARNVPRAIVGVMISIGAITVFVTMASILAIPDIPAAMTGNIADPVIQTVTFHLGSGWEKPVLLLIAMGFIGSMVALHTAGSRALYSLGRDRPDPRFRLLHQALPEPQASGGVIGVHVAGRDPGPADQHRRREGVQHAPDDRGRRVLHLVRVPDHLAGDPAAAGPSRRRPVHAREVEQGGDADRLGVDRPRADQRLVAAVPRSALVPELGSAARHRDPHRRRRHRLRLPTA